MREILIKHLVGLPLVGFERSIRLTPNSCNINRVLFGIKTSNIHHSKIQAIIEALRMPIEGQTRFFELCLNSNQIGFGFEKTSSGYACKAYVEYKDHLFAQYNTKNQMPSLLYCGIKWFYEEESWKQTDYFTHPFILYDEMVKRLSPLVPKKIREPLLNLAHPKPTKLPPFHYVESYEKGVPPSFDLNVYSQAISVKAISPIVELLSCDALVRNKFKNELEYASHKQLGHIAGGIGKDMLPYVTIYYEDNLPVPHRKVY